MAQDEPPNPPAVSPMRCKSASPQRSRERKPIPLEYQTPPAQKPLVERLMAGVVGVVSLLFGCIILFGTSRMLAEPEVRKPHPLWWLKYIWPVLFTIVGTAMVCLGLWQLRKSRHK